MTSAKEQEHSFGDGNFDNVEVEATIDTDYTFYFRDSGDDTSTLFYYDLGRGANKVQIRPTDDVTITEINGTTPKYPITITDQGFTLREGFRINSIKIRTGAACNIKVLAW